MSSVVVHLDTQILVWLYVDPLRSWPAPARQLLENGVLRYAPMARLELRSGFKSEVQHRYDESVTGS